MSRPFVSARPSRRVAAGAAGLAIALAGIAGASWSAQGTGNAKAKAGRLEPVTATPAAPSSELFPGTSAAAALTLSNPNPVAMTVSSIVGNGAITSDSAACDAAGNGVTFAGQSGAWAVASKASLPVSLPDAVSMSADAPDACQGATFTIPVAVTASVSGQNGGGTPSTTAAPSTTTTAAPTAARFEWQPSSFSFPPTEVGATSPQAAQVSLRNVGGTAAQVETGRLGSSDFPVDSSTCTGTTLAPNQACTYTIRFRPTTPGQLSAIFEARPTAATDWATLTVGGQALSPARLDVQPTSWNFGSVPVGTDSQSTTFTVRNLGQAPAQGVAVQTTDPSFQVRGGTCLGNSSLAPNGSTCTVIVGFRAASAGARSATLRINYSTATQTLVATADLVGTGS